MSDPVVVARIWAAVDRLTKPSPRFITRDPVDVEAVRRSLEKAEDSYWRGRPMILEQSTTINGTVPSLWDQSTIALTGSEHDNTGPGGDPAERSPCDIDLMEVRGIIRDTTTLELRQIQARHRLARRLPADVPARIRRMAAWVIDWEPADLWWYEYRFASWARLLATFLGEVDRANRERWLRNSPCPKCGTRQVLIDADTRRVLVPGDRVDRRVWVPALLQDFRDGHLRGIECQACGAYTFVGEQLHELAAALGVSPV